MVKFNCLCRVQLLRTDTQYTLPPLCDHYIYRSVCASFRPRHGKAVPTSVIIKYIFGSQTGKAALRYEYHNEKRAKEEVTLKE